MPRIIPDGTMNSELGILSMIFNLGAFNTLVCYIGIALFLAYTAYDTAKIRNNYYYYQGNAELLKKASIFSALRAGTRSGISETSATK